MARPRTALLLGAASLALLGCCLLVGGLTSGWEELESVEGFAKEENTEGYKEQVSSSEFWRSPLSHALCP